MKNTSVVLKKIVFALLAIAPGILFGADVSLVGFANPTDGIGKIVPIFIDAFEPKIKVNFIATSKNACKFEELPAHIVKIAHKADKTPGKVAILTDLLWSLGGSPYKLIPPESIIKIAYSMVEFSEIPKEWVDILNSKFDAVVVPDPWLVTIYKSSGVKIPIFMLPLITPIEQFLEQPIKTKGKTPLVFGNMSAGKNPSITMQAFIEAFGKSDAVKLKLHAQRDQPYITSFIEQKKLEGYNNIELDVSTLSPAEYINYMKKFDCFVCLSNGEGFSFPVREALALGIPTIINDNSALHTICETNLVRCVPADIPMVSGVVKWAFGNQARGHHLQCELEDAKKAFINMYNNYDAYLKKAQTARSWVKKYTKSALQKKYHTLVKPKVVTLGTVNEIRDNEIVTTSRSLFKKYRFIINN